MNREIQERIDRILQQEKSKFKSEDGDFMTLLRFAEV